MMQARGNPIPISEESKAMQREFAAVALRIRGYLDETYAVSYAPTSPPELAPLCIKEEVGRVNVSGVFDVPPIAAYLDGVYPLKIHLSRNAANNGGDGGYRVSLSVPRGTNRRGGPVTLVWPGASVVCLQPLTVERPSSLSVVQLADEQVSPDRILTLQGVLDEPLEVHIAGVELAPSEWEWQRRSGMLAIRIPDHLEEGTVLVITHSKVLQSGLVSFRAKTPTSPAIPLN